jgi:hypothetical protein
MIILTIYLFNTAVNNPVTGIGYMALSGLTGAISIALILSHKLVAKIVLTTLLSILTLLLIILSIIDFLNNDHVTGLIELALSFVSLLVLSLIIISQYILYVRPTDVVAPSESIMLQVS